MPEFVDTRSLVPLLAATEARAERWRRAFFIGSWQTVEGVSMQGENSEWLCRSTALQTVWRGIRTESHKYVEWPVAAGQDDDLSGCGLFDLTVDRLEMTNLCGTAEPALVAQLVEWMNALSACAGEQCRALEERPPDRAPEPIASAPQCISVDVPAAAH